MNRLYRIKAARAADERGVTVMELVVVTLLLSLVSAMVFGFLNHAVEVTDKATANERAEQELIFAMRQLTADVRSLYEISGTYPTTGSCPAGGSFAAASNYSGYRNCLRFTIYRPSIGGGNCPRTDVTYGLTNGTLNVDRVEYKDNGSGVCAASSTSSRFPLVKSVVNGAGSPVFTYYDRNGHDLLAASPARPPSGAASIRITVQKRYHRHGITLDFADVVALRNKR